MRHTILLLILTVSLTVTVQADEVSPGVMRTPDERFENLKDYDFKPNYMDIQGLRVHYLDEGPPEAAPILLIHGEPTWSYLFRKMIPVLTAAGHRVIAPDLVGFGRSDKFTLEDDYSYQLHVDVMSELVTRLDLHKATFFGQDWGGLIGLRVVGADPDRFARVVVSNTGMPAASGVQGWVGYPLFKLAVWWQGELTLEDLRTELTFPRWVAYSYHVDELPIGDLMGFMGAGDEVVEAYEAPFPDARYKAAAQIMPYLVPSQLRENEAVWRDVYEKWDKPFLVAFTDSDPVTRGGEKVFVKRIPNATNVTIKGAGHFVQEDAGPELAAMINDFVAGKDVVGKDVIGKDVSNVSLGQTRQYRCGDPTSKQDYLVQVSEETVDIEGEFDQWQVPILQNPAPPGSSRVLIANQVVPGPDDERIITKIMFRLDLESGQGYLLEEGRLVFQAKCSAVAKSEPS